MHNILIMWYVYQCIYILYVYWWPCLLHGVLVVVIVTWSSSTPPPLWLLAISTLGQCSEMQHSWHGSRVKSCEVGVWCWNLKSQRLKLEVEFIEMFSQHTSEMLSLLLLSFFSGTILIEIQVWRMHLEYIVSNILWAKVLSDSATPRRHEKLYQWSSACVCCPDRKTRCLTDKMWLDRNKHMSV